MTSWMLEKNYLGYCWRGESCWGGSIEEYGGYTTREAALERIPFGAGDDWYDMTGDPKDAPRKPSWA